MHYCPKWCNAAPDTCASTNPVTWCESNGGPLSFMNSPTNERSTSERRMSEKRVIGYHFSLSTSVYATRRNGLPYIHSPNALSVYSTLKPQPSSSNISNQTNWLSHCSTPDTSAIASTHFHLRYEIKLLQYGPCYTEICLLTHFVPSHPIPFFYSPFQHFHIQIESSETTSNYIWLALR